MPRDTLTQEQIVRTAVRLLDEEGLEGLNMRSLGKRLGAAATAVYWHVKNKDDLVLLAADRVWQEVELPPLDPEDWRSTATAMATACARCCSGTRGSCRRSARICCGAPARPATTTISSESSRRPGSRHRRRTGRPVRW